MSVVKRCDGCIAYHAKAAARAGATPGEVAEMLGVALLMDGGTASVYAPVCVGGVPRVRRPRRRPRRGARPGTSRCRDGG